MDNVFIAWSRNKSLAKKVSSLLKASSYTPILGGGTPKDMFVGSQVMNQMDRCNFAIILAQKKPEISSNAEFSDNLMFEWGYLIAKLSSPKVFAYLIDTSERELPSDLMGSWTSIVSTKGKTEEELAQEIVAQFAVEKSAVDKFEILSRWRTVKSVLASYGSSNAYTDHEVAQFVLFGVFSAYYSDDLPSFSRICRNIETTSPDLSAILSLIQTKVMIYEKTDNLSKALEINHYFELTQMLSYAVEETIKDSDLSQWTKIIRLDAMSLADSMVALGLKKQDSEIYIQHSIKIGQEVLRLIEENLEAYEANLQFARLLRGLQYRNLSLAYIQLNNSDEAKKYLDLSAKVREELYFSYRQSRDPDPLLLSKLAQEYYLVQLERCNYEISPIEKRGIVLTVEKYIVNWESEFVRQQSLLSMVKHAFEKIR